MTLTPRRLNAMVENAFAKTKQARQARVRFLQQYSGRFYRSTNDRSGDEATKASPINLLHQAITTLVPNLVFNDPRARGTTDVLAYRPYVNLLAEGITKVAQRSGLKDTIRGVVTDAILMAGFIKIGLAVGDTVLSADGTDVNLTEPYMERVSPDDMILDPMARAWDEQAFIGNKYRADVDRLLEVGYGDPDMLMKLANEVSFGGEVKNAADVTKAQTLTDEPRRFVELAEIWIPREKRVITLPYSQGMVFDEFVHEIEYAGPEKGQYHMLGYALAPDNLLPIAPAGIWYDLHILGNRIARKIARQAERNKRVLAYEDEAEEDVNAIADSNDGETVRVDDLDKIREVELGGVSEKAYEWMNWLKQNFSEQTNSIDFLGGQGSDEPTLGQAQMVQANQTVRLGDMQGIVYSFVGQAMSDVGYWLHTDPLIELPLVRRIDGVETQDYYTPEKRVGEWYEYNITTQPFSMARTDPNTAVRRKMEFATNVIPAAANAVAILGPGFKIGPFLTSIAREVGIEDADEWLNTPEVVAYIQMRMAMSQSTGDPGKANAMGKSPGLPVSFNPQQPNPGAMGPQGGISVNTESAAAQQEAAAPNQASVKALALSRGGV